jgi:hypothetical protein
MISNSRPDHPDADGQEQTVGTPEDTRLTVKLLGDDWIVENSLGTSVGSANDRESAIALAQEAAIAQNASLISVLSTDGSVEENLNT